MTDKSSQFVQFTPWLRVSATLEQGNVRKTMEDRILISQFNDQNNAYYALTLFDGHAGSSTCDYLLKHFTSTLQKQLTRVGSHKIREVLDATFVDLHNQVKHLDSGSTVSLILIIQRENKQIEVFSANVGDSSVYGVLSEKEKIKIRKLSTDHNLEYKKDRERVARLENYTFEDGYVMTEDGSGINMTRSIGDSAFGMAISPHPTIRKISVPYSTIMMASDGIWDKVLPLHLWERLNHKKWKTSAYELNKWRNSAYESHDNTSLILIFLDHSKFP